MDVAKHPIITRAFEMKGELVDLTARLNQNNKQTVLDYFDELTQVISNLLIEKSDLSTKIESLKLEKALGSKPTYAEKLKERLRERSKSRDRGKEYVVILSKNEKSTEEVADVKELVMTSIDPKKIKVGINRSRKLRNGDLFLELSKKDDVDSLKNEIMSNSKLKDKIISREPIKKNPRLIVFGVSKTISEENIREAVKEQNDIENVEVKIQSSFPAKNGLNYILEIDPDSFKVFKRKGKVNINWEKFNCKEYLKPRLCFKCLKFGHTVKFCKAEKSCCYKCGVEGHEGKDCTDLIKNCYHCKNFNLKDKERQLDTNHWANDRSCVNYIKEMENLKKYINYG